MANKPKTHKGTVKRVKLTGRGKLRRHRAYGSHLLTKKRPARKRRFKKEYKFKDGDKHQVKKTLGL